MHTLFGTDGIRDKAHQGLLSRENVFKLGAILGEWLKTKEYHSCEKVLIGKDTRESCDEIEAILSAGIAQHGYSPLSLGVLSTPALAFLTKSYSAVLGIMISASHNPWEYNGIKLFSRTGIKCEDDQEKWITKMFFGAHRPYCVPASSKVFFDMDFAQKGRAQYREWLEGIAQGTLSGKIVIDCAHGALSTIAPELFRRLGAEVEVMGASPNGQNINYQCGSLHPQQLAAAVLAHKAHMGFAFDGDGDRVIAVDEEGYVRDGDFMIGVLAQQFMAKNQLKQRTVVSTHMANIGLELFLKSIGCSMIREKVGDRYILARMCREGYSFGGEQSGHIIFLDESPIGDGLLTAVKLAATVRDTGKTLSSLCAPIQKYPQLILNLRVPRKVPLEEMKEVNEYIQKQEQRLMNKGRVYVRYSGTEPYLRIMVEGEDKYTVEDIGGKIYTHLEERIHETAGS